MDENEICYLEISLYICQNTSDYDQCKSPEEIQEFFSSPKYLQINAYNAYVKFDDYENPLLTEYPIFYQLIDFQMHKEMSVFFQGVELITEDGFLFDSQSIINDITNDKMTSDIEMRQEADYLLSDINLYASHDKLQQTRRYQTLSEVLASLSGTANFFMFFCFFLTNLTNYLNTITTIINALYTFPDINANQKKKSDFDKKAEIKFIKNEAVSKYQDLKGNISSTILKDNENLMYFSKEDKKNIEKSIENVNIGNPTIFNLKQDMFPKCSTNPANNSQFIKDFKGLIPAKNLEDDSFRLMHYSQEDLKKGQKKSNNSPRVGFKKIMKTNYKPAVEIVTEVNVIKPCEVIKPKLSIGFFEYIKYWLKKICFFKKSRKEKWIEKSEKIFKKELDIISILAKLKEFEKLKLILLNEDQLIIFEGLSNPMLNLEEKQIFLNYENQPSIKMLNLIKNYQRAKQNKEILAKSLINIKKNQNKYYEDQINQRLISKYKKKFKKKVFKNVFFWKSHSFL